MSEELETADRYKSCLFLRELDQERLMFFHIDSATFVIQGISGKKEFKLLGFGISNYKNIVVPSSFEPEDFPYVYVYEQRSVHI